MELSIIVVLLVAGLFYYLYASIIKKRNRALESLSGIDVQFNMRFDLIPNILKVAKKFMEHEKSLLEDVTKLRTQVQSGYNKQDRNEVQEHLQSVESLSSKMGQLMISVEDYPDLTSNETMVQAMRTYNEVEANISAARRSYNASVTELNNTVQIFPGNLVASMINIKEMPFFEAAPETKRSVDADSYL